MRKTILMILFIFSLVSLNLAQSNNWTGFYVGGNVGGTSDKADADAGSVLINQVTNLKVGSPLIVVPATTVGFTESRRKTNAIGGFQAGYLWQSKGFVIGPEVDFNPFGRTVNVTRSYQLPITLLTQPTTVEIRRGVRLSNEFSVRARAGGAIGKTLIYGTFGYITGRVKVSVNDSFTNPGGATQTTPPATLGPSGPVVTTGSDKENMNGWTAGGGVERKIGKHFSIGFEYRHNDLRSKNFAFSNTATTNTGPEARGTDNVAGLPGGIASGPTNVSLKSDSFSVRFNFHF